MFEQVPDLLAAYPLIAFGLVFAAGVASSASPCALATVPLVVGYVGGHAGDEKRPRSPRSWNVAAATVPSARQLGIDPAPSCSENSNTSKKVGHARHSNGHDRKATPQG